MNQILIYTPKTTTRISYIFRHIFVRILNIPIKFTSTIEEFIAYEDLKISYGKAPLGKEFFIQSHGLLTQQGINDVEIIFSTWENTPCFFNTGKKSTIPFDLFSASFYLLSRYEEYLPSMLDDNECFSAKESIAYQQNFLEKPMIDIWAFKLLRALKNYYPEFKQVPKKFNYISTFAINQTFLFKSKGAIRNFLGYFSDFFTLNFYNLWTRLGVNLKLKSDPFNTFDQILALQKKYNIKTLFFFLVANYTTYDNNLNFTKKKYQLLIKSVADYCSVGLLASYFTMRDEDLLKKENKRLTSIVNTPTLQSKQHLQRNKLPETYRTIIDLGIKEDYSMAYYNYLGFRASTCTPFYFYDLDFEIQTPLKIFPIAFSDENLRFHLQLSPEKAITKVNTIYNTVKDVNGTLVSVFHNDSLSNFGAWKYWQGLYEHVLICMTNDD